MYLRICLQQQCEQFGQFEVKQDLANRLEIAMTIDIKRDTNFDKKVRAGMIHGKFPYKMYLEILGVSLIGKYIVVVGDKPLGNGLVDSVLIQTTDKEIKEDQSVSKFAKPNMEGNYHIRYSVKEMNVLDVPDVPLVVFKRIVKEST